MSKYLIASPDRYGRFGHQTLSISAGILVAAITDSKLIKPRYMYFCDKWNQYVDFSRSNHVCSSLKGSFLKVSYVENPIPDQNGNRKYDANDLRSILELLKEICKAEDNSLIHLPFDQTVGKLLRLYNKNEYRYDMKKIYKFSGMQRLIDKKYVCIHIRRGDCTPSVHPAWYVNDFFYIQLIELLARLIPESWCIVVCTQGDISWITNSVPKSLINPEKLKVFSTPQLFTNDREVQDFCIMKDADILFGAASSFSLCALLLGEHKLTFDITRAEYHPIDSVIRVNPDYEVKYSLSIIEHALQSIIHQ